MNEKKYLKWYQKAAYGSGDAAANCGYALISSFMMLYLTNSVGLNSAIIGTLMMISRIFDGITDIIFGTLIDHTKSRLGKARPWMLYGQIGVSLCLFLVFCIPNMSEGMQYAYFFVFYTAFNAIFFTMNNIAYATLSALITKNPEERVQLGAFRSIFALAMTMFVMTAALNMVDSFGGGARGWRMTALIFAILGFVINTFSCLMVKELPDEGSEGNERGKPKDDVKFSEALRLLFKNKYYIIMVGLYLLVYSVNSIAQGSGIYMTKYYFQKDILGVITLAKMVPMVLAMVVTPFLVKRFKSIQKVSLYGYILAVVAGSIQIFAAMQKNIGLFLIATAICGIAISPYSGSTNALLAEVADYTRRTQNAHIEGMIFSCSSIGVKLGGGIGSAIVGILLEIGGFDGMAEVQQSRAIGMIFFMYAILPVILNVCITVLISFLKVEKANTEWDQKHKEEVKV